MSEIEYLDGEYQYSGTFDDGIELAYILNKSMELKLTQRWQSVRRAEAIESDVHAIVSEHMFWVPFLGDFRMQVTPEPYKSIHDASNKVSGAAKELCNRNIWTEQAKAVNQTFQSELINAIGEFCARNSVETTE